MDALILILHKDLGWDKMVDTVVRQPFMHCWSLVDGSVSYHFRLGEIPMSKSRMPHVRSHPKMGLSKAERRRGRPEMVSPKWSRN